MTDREGTGHEPAPVFAAQFDLLKQEMTLINSAIRSHDDIMKGIKNWSIVTWTASIGLVMSSPRLTALVWATAFVPFAFFLVDAAFRRVQRTFVVRQQEIAAFLNSPAFVSAAETGTALEFPLMQFRSKSGAGTGWLAVMRFRTVWVLYLLMISGSVLMHLLLRS